MGRSRTELNDVEFQRRQNYYKEHKTEILARAKARYQEDREVMLATARKIRNAAREVRLRSKRTWTPHYKKRIDVAKDFVRDYKDGKACIDCGVVYPFYVLDFDHVRGIKHSALSELIYSGPSVKTLIREIDKCDLVCANCHRERTYRRMQESKV